MASRQSGSDFDTDLRRSLQQLREESRLSQTALAAELGWDQAKVSRIESGNHGVTVQEMFAWGEAVGCQPDMLASLAAGLWMARGGRPRSLWHG
jgi:transcriptional regulator with XRE-family HTH domain